MDTILSPGAAKYLKRLNEPDKTRIINSIKKLEYNPPQGDIKSLSGKNGYRLRIGKYRALFDIIDNEIIITGDLCFCFESFASVVCLDGEGDICHGENKYKIKKGDSYFIPAGVEFKIAGNLEIIMTTI